jgi:hypothetical protein
MCILGPVLMKARRRHAAPRPSDRSRPRLLLSIDHGIARPQVVPTVDVAGEGREARPRALTRDPTSLGIPASGWGARRCAAVFCRHRFPLTGLTGQF